METGWGEKGDLKALYFIYHVENNPYWRIRYCKETVFSEEKEFICQNHIPKG